MGTGGMSVIHALSSLPRQAWWLIAILAGLSLLGGGGSKKKRGSRKSRDEPGSFAIIVVVGVVLLAAGAGGGVTKVIHRHHGPPDASGPCSGVGSVPASQINGAAASLGISCRIVRAQINMESGGDPGSYSPAKAKGVAQFLQGTWDSHHCAGSPWNAGDSMSCYVIYMRELIRSEGSVRRALAAYNAGPGNIAAGMGYADAILSAAGA